MQARGLVDRGLVDRGLVVDGVSVAYGRGEPVLREVSLTASAGCSR